MELYYYILSHPCHPLHTYLLTREFDMLYENCPSCIPSFRIRMFPILFQALLFQALEFDLDSCHIRPLGISKVFLPQGNTFFRYLGGVTNPGTRVIYLFSYSHSLSFSFLISFSFSLVSLSLWFPFQR